MVRMSSGLKNHLLSSGSFINAFNLGVIELYSGSQPTTADQPPNGSLLGKITAGGGAFTPGSPANGLQFLSAPQSVGVTKALTQDWIATFTADGTIGWWRLKPNTLDNDALSTVALRLDGDFTAPFDELYLPNAAVTTGSTQTVELFLLTFE